MNMYSLIQSPLLSISIEMQTSSNLFDKAVVRRLQTLNGPERHELVRNFWPGKTNSLSAFDEFSCRSIVEHIAKELDKVRHHQDLFAAHDFDSVISIIRTLQKNSSKRYDEVVRELLAEFPNTSVEAVRRSVELTVRIWLTANTHTADIFVGPISAGDAPIDWPGDRSLEQLLQSCFGHRVQLPPQKVAATIDPAFTATYLVSTCGVRLQWTDDILTHLNFDLKRLVLTVYRHKACLLAHLDHPQGCSISKEILEEILDTMDLLFPPSEMATKHLLMKEGQQSLYTLGCRRGNRVLDIAHYQYFGEALEHLVESFDKVPRTWRQLAFDRRNKLEWSAFWITVLVGILTLVSIPCNIIQATYSVKAYHIALAQGGDATARREL
jgi:hypothetical protein